MTLIRLSDPARSSLLAPEKKEAYIRMYTLGLLIVLLVWRGITTRNNDGRSTYLSKEGSVLPPTPMAKNPPPEYRRVSLYISKIK